MITAPFAPKARREAEVFGMGDLPLVVVRHLDEHDIAIGQMQEADVVAIANESAAEIRFVLTASRTDVAAVYHGATGAVDRMKIERR